MAKRRSTGSKALFAADVNGSPSSSLQFLPTSAEGHSNGIKVSYSGPWMVVPSLNHAYLEVKNTFLHFPEQKECQRSTSCPSLPRCSARQSESEAPVRAASAELLHDDKVGKDGRGESDMDRIQTPSTDCSSGEFSPYDSEQGDLRKKSSWSSLESMNSPKSRDSEDPAQCKWYELGVDGLPTFVRKTADGSEVASSNTLVEDSMDTGIPSTVASGESVSNGDSDGEGDKEIGKCTTLMIRGIPPKTVQRNLSKQVNQLGYTDEYDFLYMPIDCRTRANRGFAFINFETPEKAREFYEKCNGVIVPVICTDKPLEILPAHIQGFETNATHFGAGATGKRMCKPLVLRKGGYQV